MAGFSERIQRNFIERFGRIVRSSHSLRARIRDQVQIGQNNTLPSDATEVNEPVAARTTFAPEGYCLYAIGDIHGRLDLLELMIDLIREDAATLPEGTKSKIIFLGDYIDRGLQSRQVIDYFLNVDLSDFETVFLMGNHEEALLRFLNERQFGTSWVRFGGAETLFSYGLQPPNARASFGNADQMKAVNDAWDNVWTKFHEVLPIEHRQFFENLTSHHIEGDYMFVHAGIRPDVPIDQQSPRDLLWIRDEFLDDPTEHEKLIVHGHTMENEVYQDNRRIGLDTGAYMTGRLTAARLIGDEIGYLATA